MVDGAEGNQPVTQSKREKLEALLWEMTRTKENADVKRLGEAIFKLVRSMPEPEVLAAMDTIDARIEMLERAAFGDTVENLKHH